MTRSTRFRSLLAVVALLGLASPLLAQTSPADGTADAAFATLRKDFGHLFRSLSNMRGISDVERPAVEACQDRVTEFAAQNPGHEGGVALAIQLARWLGDREAAEAGYERLLSLRPDDASIALSWLKYQESREDADPADVLASYQRLQERFSSNVQIAVGLAQRLMDEARYPEALEILEGAAIDASEPEPLFLQAECLFAEHRFEEASAVAENIDPAAIQNVQLRADVFRQKPQYQKHIELWAAEQALRAAEAETNDLPRAELVTSKGRILVELFENQAPNTVANHISLASSGFYAGTRFHRYVPNFMIQGGDPSSRPGTEGTPGTGDPGYKIPDEHTREGARNHFRDSLAMAKTADPNSGGCQFYFNHKPTPWLNGKHTVFGRVLEGLDVVRSLRQDDEIIAVNVLRKRDHAYEPVTLPN